MMLMIILFFILIYLSILNSSFSFVGSNFCISNKLTKNIFKLKKYKTDHTSLENYAEIHKSIVDLTTNKSDVSVPLELLEYILHVNPTMKRTNAKKYLSLGNVLINDEPQSQFNFPLISGFKLYYLSTIFIFLNEIFDIKFIG